MPQRGITSLSRTTLFAECGLPARFAKSRRCSFGVQLFRNAERIVASLSGMGTGAVLDFNFGVWSLPYHAERLTKIWRLVKSRSSTDKPRSAGSQSGHRHDGKDGLPRSVGQRNNCVDLRRQEESSGL